MRKVILSACAALCLSTGAFAEWGTPATPPASAVSIDDIDALRQTVAGAWERMPLTIRRAIFIQEKAEGFGIYTARSSNTFKPGEKLFTYIEPVGYVWKPRGDLFDFGVTADWVLKSAAGKILGGQEAFARLVRSSHARNQEFMLDLTMSVDGLAAGNYVLEYKLHDAGSDKVAAFAQPFTIAD